MVEAFLPPVKGKSLKEKVAAFVNEVPVSDVMTLFEWTGILEEKLIPGINQTPAAIIQNLLESKWKLKPGDKDRIVMVHQFFYTVKEKKFKLQSQLIMNGKNSTETAMAATVGLPLGISCELFLDGKIKAKGVQIPVIKEIYEPVLNELENFGINFKEDVTEVD